jgi:predicted aspartyl protease
VVTGEVNADREIVFTLQVVDKQGQPQHFPVVLDTGFNRSMTMPRLMLERLGLVPTSEVQVILGDGSTQYLKVYDAAVIWDGVERPVTIHEAEGVPLIGTGLVYGYALYLHMVDGGRAAALRLP